jgi:tRNA threonylcarbamoyladenosine biosynthesis protein TsaB
LLILAADTSGKRGSIALATAKPAGSCEVLEVVPLAGGTFSAQMIPQVASLLTHHGFSREDISAFAVASGPGSFTGLRVGLAAVKALAEVLQKPIATVSLLEVVAAIGSRPGIVLAAMDAGRGEVYLGEYNWQAATATCISEQLLSRQSFAARCRGRRVVTADSGWAETARQSGAEVEQIAEPDSASIAQLGWRKILRKETTAPDYLDANYIRRSDAEIFAKRVES